MAAGKRREMAEVTAIVPTAMLGVGRGCGFNVAYHVTRHKSHVTQCRSSQGGRC